MVKALPRKEVEESAQGVALAAQKLGVTAIIVMPATLFYDMEPITEDKLKYSAECWNKVGEITAGGKVAWLEMDLALRKKRLMSLIHLFLIHRYKAASVHYVTPTEDNEHQAEGMKAEGIFASVAQEVGEDRQIEALGLARAGAGGDDEVAGAPIRSNSAVAARSLSAELVGSTDRAKRALDSVYSLFPTTRTIIRTHGRDAMEFTKIAVVVLNQIVRPFTAKWHRLSLQGRLKIQCSAPGFAQNYPRCRKN